MAIGTPKLDKINHLIWLHWFILSVALEWIIWERTRESYKTTNIEIDYLILTNLKCLISTMIKYILLSNSQTYILI